MKQRQWSIGHQQVQVIFSLNFHRLLEFGLRNPACHSHDFCGILQIERERRYAAGP